jgi:TatD DNase family protein
MKIVDSHCHLNFTDFKDDLDQVIKRAGESGVAYMQTICTKLEEYEELKALADRYKNIFCSVGVHPHDTVNESSVNATILAKMVRGHDKTIGIGETGLDYFYEHSNRVVQKKLFAEHIQAAQDTQVPLIIHTRDAEQDTLEMLTSEMRNSQFKALIHCFTASKDFGFKCLDLGLYISISGIITFKKSTELQEAVKSYPLSSLLVETDSPYLAPVPYRGNRNEPVYCQKVVEFIANLKGVSYQEVAKITTENFFSLFSKANK